MEDLELIKDSSEIEYTDDYHPIYPDSKDALEIGFTSDKFHGYLWKDKDSIHLSLIVSLYEGKGNTRRLIESIKEKYSVIKACEVSERMRNLLNLQGFKEEIIDVRYLGKYKGLVWRK